MAHKEISTKELNVNPVTMFSDGWAILTAGSENDCNGMTVSWGAIGEIWGKAAMFVFVRPQRYTHDFCEKSDYFTVSCFGGKEREALSFFGSKSGRDCDKFRETGLTAKADGDYIYCDEAELVFLCKLVLYSTTDFSSDIIDLRSSADTIQSIYVRILLEFIIFIWKYYYSCIFRC